MTEEVITSLTRVPLLNVIARNTTFGYKNKQYNIEDVGKELGVGFLLEGSARKQGNKIRISVQLVEVKSISHIWAQTYNSELADILKGNGEWVKFWREFDTKEEPHSWLVWPNSKIKGWCDPITGII